MSGYSDYSQFMNPEMGVAAVIGIILLAIIVIAVSLLIYFLPFVVALLRKHRQKVAIFVLDLFLGWSFIGWIIALVWAFTNDKNNDNNTVQ